MDSQSRQEYIINRIKTHNQIKVNEIAVFLQVTPETIRKDLTLLEEKKLLTRIHGGAVKYKHANKEMALQKRLNVNKEIKQVLAKEAAKMIKSGDTIVIDIGTTTLYIADYLEDITSLTVVTNSLFVCEKFNQALEEQRISGQVIMLGGISNPEQRAISGVVTVQQISNFSFDKAFISCGSFDETSIYDFDMNESLCSQSMIENSQMRILITDSSKFLKRSFYKIDQYHVIDYVITDFDKPESVKGISTFNWKNVRR